MRTALISLFLAAGLVACQTRTNGAELTQAPAPMPAPNTPSPTPNTPIPYNPAIPTTPPTAAPGTGGGSAEPAGTGGGEFGAGGGPGGGTELPGAPADGGLTLRVHGSVATAR